MACYSLSSRLDSIVNRAGTLRWLVGRQVNPLPVTLDSDEDGSAHDDDASVTEDTQETTAAGFQGRIGKATDACYSFWCSAAIKVSDGYVYLGWTISDLGHITCR